jgi:hypothetical protein
MQYESLSKIFGIFLYYLDSLYDAVIFLWSYTNLLILFKVWETPFFFFDSDFISDSIILQLTVSLSVSISSLGAYTINISAIYISSKLSQMSSLAKSICTILSFKIILFCKFLTYTIFLNWLLGFDKSIFDFIIWEEFLSIFVFYIFKNIFLLLNFFALKKVFIFILEFFLFFVLIFQIILWIIFIREFNEKYKLDLRALFLLFLSLLCRVRLIWAIFEQILFEKNCKSYFRSHGLRHY